MADGKNHHSNNIHPCSRSNLLSFNKHRSKINMSMSQQLAVNQQLTEIESKALECGIDKNIYMSLTESIYPNAKHHSVCMVIAYCKAKKIDPMLKPVHIVPMSVKTDKKDDR